MKQVVVVTGAASGIGRATVEHFAEAGWEAVGIDRVAGATYQIDIAEVSSLETTFEEIGRRHGRIDALVNNAAVQVAKRLVDTTLEDFDRVMAVNVRAAFFAIKHALPHLSGVNGSVINVSSVHAIASSTEIAAYAASKGALLALTRALAVELASRRIRVNAILPGAVDTPMLRAGLERGHLASATLTSKLAELGARTVIGRVGLAAEIAHAIMFLADSSKSGFVTGQALVVDGGATARLSTE